MKTQNSASANAVSKSVTKNASKKQVNNNATSTRRVETRDHWEVIFNHSVVLIANYAKGIKVDNPREGFAFGPTPSEPHSRAYAKSLIWGFATNRAGKVLKNLDEVAEKAVREKIAMAILTDCKLVKGDSEAIKAQLVKVETKRERAIAEAVLTELTKPEPTTPKGGKKSQSKTEKATAPKGSKNSKPTAPKGSKAKAATRKGSKPQTKSEEVVVKDYAHFRTDYGVVTIPTLGKAELEDKMAKNALKRFLEEQIKLIRKDENHDEAYLAEINDTLKGELSVECIGWSNEVTPEALGEEQIVILKDNKAAKQAWLNGIELDDLTPLKGWKAKAAKKSTTKGGRKSRKAAAK